ncbi:kinase-like protein, partial [Ophiobolus disseminans]
RTLGRDHKDTLGSRYWLVVTLHAQQKYGEAEQLLRQVVQQQEKVLGGYHKDTFASKELLQQVVLAKVPPALTNSLAEVVSSRLSDFFTDGSQSQVNAQWSKVPRTYIILRIIGCLDLLNTFIDLGVSDYWFPFTKRSLPPCLRPDKCSQFVAAQNLVMTKSMDLEKGEEGQHCYFRQDEPLPLEMKGVLGSGGFGQVDRVLSTISFREYALKRVSRSAVFSGRTNEDIRRRAECIKQFIAEIGALKRLKHHHVVEFVGSYTDAKYMGLIMSPIADMDLYAYLAGADTARYRELRTFFGCLAQALAFLHEQSIRHKDIKPSNILVHGGNVLFTDFGLAFDFTNKDGSTTVSMVNGMTPKYCAPEVADYEPRNTSSDIWSLGVVFLEMTAVLKGRTVEHMYDFLKEHGSGQAYVRTNRTGTNALIAELKETGSPTDNAPLGAPNWTEEYKTLYQLRLSDKRQCLTCPHAYRSTVLNDSPGLLLSLTRTTPTFDDALNDFFQSQVNMQCPKCLVNTDQAVESQIVAAPQVLKVTMAMFIQELYGPEDKETGAQSLKNIKFRHSLQHLDLLDLTNRQMHNPLPLHYRLSSVISHYGTGVDNGHNVASVRGQGGKFQAISNRVTQDFTLAQFLASPQRPSEVWAGKLEVYVLMYLRESVGGTRAEREVAGLASKIF